MFAEFVLVKVRGVTAMTTAMTCPTKIPKSNFLFNETTIVLHCGTFPVTIKVTKNGVERVHSVVELVQRSRSKNNVVRAGYVAQLVAKAYTETHMSCHDHGTKKAVQ